MFNDWIITRELGEGATGKVFEIQKNDHSISAKAALKVIRIPKSVSDVQEIMSEGMDEVSVTQYFRGFVDEILREIRIMISLKDHPNIVAYEDHLVREHEEEIGWDILIKMELLTPLSRWMTEHPVDERTVIRLGCEISSALAYATDGGLVHRDVKPENIFVDQMGRFKLGDFGIARTIEKTTGGLSKKGTENYMAPEVYQGKNYNDQIDIYSLGIVLYRLMNHNRLPFYPPITQAITFNDRENALMKRMQGNPLPAPANGSREFQKVILKACEYLPENRFKTMHEMYNALQQVKKTEGETKKTPKTLQPTEDSKVETSKSSLNTDPVNTTVNTGSTEGKGNRQSAPGAGSGKKIAIAVGAVLLAGACGYGIYHGVQASKTYEMVVKNGTGSGSYKAGEAVEIHADIPEGEHFTKWEAEGISLSEEESQEAELTLDMPSEAVRLTALSETDSYQVRINGGSGSGEYQPDEKIVAEAEAPEDGYQFAGWEVTQGQAQLSDDSQNVVWFTMPEGDVELTAKYEEISYNVTVENGTGGGSFHAGDTVTLTADAAPENQEFKGWSVNGGTLDLSDAGSQTISFTMPGGDVSLSAQYEDVSYNVTVENGTGGGSFHVGDTVTLTADAAPENQQFKSWSVNGENLELTDTASQTVSFTMPEGDVALSANYGVQVKVEPLNGWEVSGKNYIANINDKVYEGDAQLTKIGEIVLDEDLRLKGFVYGTDLLCVRKGEDGGYALMDLKGNILTDFDYNFWTNTAGDGAEYGWILSRKYGSTVGQVGILAMDGSEVVPFEYDYLKILNANWIVGYKDDANGNTLETTVYNVGSNQKISAVFQGKLDVVAEEDYLNIKFSDDETVTYDSSFTEVASPLNPYVFDGITEYAKAKEKIEEAGNLSVEDCSSSRIFFYWGIWLDKLGLIEVTEWESAEYKMGLFDYDGNVIVPAEYGDFFDGFSFSLGYFKMEKSDGTIDYIRKDGAIIYEDAPEDGYLEAGDGTYTLVAADGQVTSRLAEEPYIVGTTGHFRHYSNSGISGDTITDWHGNIVFDDINSINFDESWDGKYVLLENSGQGMGSEFPTLIYRVDG